MIDLIPFAFEEHLVRAVTRDGAPWFVGKDVCAALGLKNHNDALSKLDDDERAEVGLSDPSGTKRAVAVSEPGVYRLTFSSRKPEAERFKRWLAHEVLPQIRKTGRFGSPDAALPPPRLPDQPSSFLEKIQTVRECRLVHGQERARQLWTALGLPCVPEAPPSLYDDALACLRLLLSARLASELSIREMIERALDDDEEQRICLLEAGIRLLVDGRREGFVVANGAMKRLEDIFAGTEWGQQRWGRVLRRLPGSAPIGPLRYQGRMRRGTFVPADYLDEGRMLGN